jgi:thiamine biosynthesis protein ThiI
MTANRTTEPLAPPEYSLVLARMGELWLKGRNRQQFVDRLSKNVAAHLRAAVPGARISTYHGRLFLEVPEPSKAGAVLDVAADTPGLTSASPVVSTARDLDAIREAALDLTRRAWARSGMPTGTFACNARRTDKDFPVTSPEINRAVGGAVAGALGLRVQLKAPDYALGVEIGRRAAYLWVETRPAVGGLPIGSTGRVMLLLSGGIDSPVAGYLAQKRGCELEAVYFHSPPFISEASKDKVVALARSLAPRQAGLKLHVVRLTEIQKAVRDACDARYTVLLYRRFMYRLAAAWAGRRGCQALCTGENLAQVASQTLENLTVVDRVTGMLTMRPLICFDKQETTELARRIGTYQTSILPHDDCCTLFVPKNPMIKSTLKAVEAQEGLLERDALVEAALGSVETIHIPA